MADNLGQELASLDFANLIGGPLNALIEAQTKAALTTSNFIKAVGFTPEIKDGDGKVTGGGEIRNVSFRYKKQDPKDGETKDYELTVPFLTMVPIPYIRVDTAEIEFNAKINSVLTEKTAQSIDVGVSLDASYNALFVKASLKASFSYKQSKETNSQTDRTYSMRILVKAANQELPAGTERLLGILESAIKEVPVTTE
jgi:hypothetical protein